MLLSVLLAALISYLLGNINGAVIISRLIGKKDVREQGSGNAGLTNFLRMYGPTTAILVVVIDVLKAVGACIAGKLLLAPYGYGQEGLLLGGLAVNLGHDFPALLGFRGGKGVLCGITAAFMADWRCALLVIVVFALCLWLTRYVSLSSILGALTFAITFPIVHRQNVLLAVMGATLGLFIVFMHRSNISRLLKGTERKATFSKFRRNK
ncbi:MAG: glycerol-3-phosphate 1-O-acyltransferase PlsY [Oscillospiraceae bacterium]|nr:glycerol-3-phosphate 1-O-acyltransferase PlsY [Oscillospiraceae bacterium]